jgi:hypothetical protein
MLAGSRRYECNKQIGGKSGADRPTKQRARAVGALDIRAAV